MVALSHSMPLLSLDGVVIDTETTGLDATTARVIRIGAIRLKAGRPDPASRFDRLVKPGGPIPREATAVHGIEDADVEGAPLLGEILPDLEAFLGSALLIGHNIGYDLAVLSAEYRRAGRAWRQPRSLDVRMLARIAAPTLAHYSLKPLCEWLAIETKEAGSTIDDAIATAQVYEALVPILRRRNIRTLAEALAASRELTDDEARTAGGLSGGRSDTGAGEETRPLARIDSFPYRHLVRDVMSTPPVFAAAGTTLAEAILILLDRKISSVYVRDHSGALGIVTERDLLRAIGSNGAEALTLPIGTIMNSPLQTVSEDAFVYRAIGRMDRLGFRHLGVRNSAGEITGAVTTRNLLRHRASHAIVLGDEIDSASTSAALARAWAQLPLMARSLLEQDVDPRTISHVISSEIRILTRRAAQLAEAAMADDGRGPPPVPYSVLVLGSAGRGESLLAADQDNAIVYERGEAGGDEDRWFEDMAIRMSDILDAAGVPLCKGGVMAKNRAWRMSRADWTTTIDGWVRRQRPEDLLNVDIFFDAIPVHGDFALGESIWSYAYDRGRAAPDFLKLMSNVAAKRAPAFTFLGNLRLDDSSRIDLKMTGLMPIFTAARILAIRHGIKLRPTPDRLLSVHAAGVGNAGDIDAVVEAHRALLGATLAQQLLDTERGVPLSSRVDPVAIGKSAKADLSKALGKVDILIDLVNEGRH